LLEIKGMKKVILIGLLAAVSFSRGLAGTRREELMARMGFSKEEIARDAAAHKAVAGTLDAMGGKGDPKTAASVLREADEINQLRTSRALRQEAESLAAEAEKRAALAKIKQEEAEADAEVARREARKMTYNGSGALAYGKALDARDHFVTAAQEARTLAKEEARKAEQARVAADAVIAKAKATEAKLEKERLARVVANKER
jgi:hypothetical protein